VDLKQIIDMQWEFNLKLNKFPDSNDLLAKQQMTSKFILEMFSEMNELLQEINFKDHRPEISIKESNIRIQWIDIFKYWLSIGQVWNWKEEELVETFIEKSAVVEQRYKQEKKLNLSSVQTVGVDIDGVLADYPTSFFNFIHEKTGVKITTEDYDIYDRVTAAVGKDEAEKLKAEYRESGYKQNISVVPGAKQFLEKLKSKGFYIVLLTSRPYQQYKRIYSDTLIWLAKNDLLFDAIIWDENKNYKAIKQFPKMEFMVEDNGQFALNIAKLGYKVFLIDKSYNQSAKHDLIKRVSNLGEIHV